MKTCLELGGAGLTLLGVIIGVYGTYILTKWTHPLGWWGFNWSVLVMFWNKLTRSEDRITRINEVSTKLAAMSVENKAESLHGLHWVFFGFVLQTLGAVLLAFDAAWVNFILEKSSKTIQ